MSNALAAEDLFFSQSSTSVSSISRQVRKADITQSIANRLRSINSDVEFVTRQAVLLDLPVVANERCGSWYVPPSIKAESAYFKSTDGHAGQWAFNLRRLNLHILTLIGSHGGCVLVDATRRGKHAPDALAKTVPIWCAVINGLLFPEHDDAASVYVHPHLVGESERTQIANKIPQFIHQARQLDLELALLKDSLKRPMLPHWIVRSLPHQGALSKSDHELGYNRVYLCMASEYCEMTDDANYIQGAGDDSESWARGLTPELFWAHRERLLSASQADLPQTITTLCQESDIYDRSDAGLIRIAAFPRLWIGKLDAKHNLGLVFAKILVGGDENCPTDGSPDINRRQIHLRCRSGKLGSRDLRRELFKIPSFLERLEDCMPVAVLSAAETDLAAGVTLAIMSLYNSASGDVPFEIQHERIDKTLIKRKLACITSSMPAANPSRTTLNAVNSFLMGNAP